MRPRQRPPPGVPAGRQVREGGVLREEHARLRIILRATLEELTAFGDGGRQPGQFYGVHNIATDSKGNVYTTETWEGKRLQKFVYKGMAPVAQQNQGTVWQ